MKLGSYLSLLRDHGLVKTVPEEMPSGKEVRAISYNSQDVREDTLFVCKGAAFRKEYLLAAAETGAFAYVSETDYRIPGLPALIVNDIRKAMTVIAKAFYAVPEEEMNIIGVTGTKGKTTTCFYMKQILDAYNESSGEEAAAILTSIEIFDGIQTVPSSNTTPEIFEGYSHLKNAYDSGIRDVVMEVSSQGLKYGRVDGITFNTAVFLNISPDHISPIEHPDEEDYLRSKLKIFRQCRNAVINLDCDHSDEVIRASINAEAVYTYSESQRADFMIADLREEGGHVFFTFCGEDREIPFELGMRGAYNAENAAAAIIAARLQGIPYEIMQEALRKASVPGRGESFSTADGRIKAIVDYAHNEVSCRAVLLSARNEFPDRKIISVFGCPGGKGLNRREGMGKAISELSDRIYLTADDPAGESVEEICREIADNIEGCPYRIVPDREEAIAEAFGEAEGSSVIMVLGKGCETAQKVGKQNVFYRSDAVNVAECIQRYNNEHSN
ncbi:MAG: UDP-N-acetylmuramyl-tripeptide synthetase [Lachnospiraceae bacterium]|nr:UDP-N-acetylmuramyl-tripeptide synthetase [Lachnospiraceae bacterium]